MRRTLIASLLAVTCIGFVSADDTLPVEDNTWTVEDNTNTVEDSTETVTDNTRVRIELDREALGGLMRDLEDYTRT